MMSMACRIVVLWASGGILGGGSAPVRESFVGPLREALKERVHLIVCRKCVAEAGLRDS